MPMIPKAFHNYPPNTDTPINAAALAGLEGRVGNYVGSDGSVGPGAFSFEDFRPKQHAAGDMTVDIGLPNVLMAAYIALDGNGSIERYEYSGAQLNQAIGASDPTNPRIDQIVLVPGVTDSVAPTTAVIPGTPTAGATLLNRNGAAALPVGRMRIADVLVGAAATQILTANIFDRRPFGVAGGLPQVATLDRVVPVPNPNLLVAGQQIGTGLDATQAAALHFIPRRIALVNTLRFKVVQGGTPLTGNFNLGIYDASGTLIVATGSNAWTGAGNAVVNMAPTISPTTFEVGLYFLVLGLGTLAGGTLQFMGSGMVVSSTAAPGIGGIALRSATGGVALPNNLSAFVDVGVATSAIGTHAVPGFALSVG